MVVGAPGSGKTTLLKYLALSFARGQSQARLALAEDRFPIYAALRDFSRFLDNYEKRNGLPSQLTSNLMAEFLSEQHRDTFPHVTLPRDFFPQLLCGGECAVLFDGLDEVADPLKRSRVTEAVSSCLKDFHSNRFVITSRPRGYDTECRQIIGSYCAECSIRDFDNEQIKAFVENWYLAVTLDSEGDSPTSRDTAKRKALDLLPKLEADRIRPLSKNPLLLSILALIHQRGLGLPQRRVALYDECVEFLLGYWDLRKDGESSRDLASMGGLDRKEKRALLEPIALWLHERGSSGTEASAAELERELGIQIKNLYGGSDPESRRRARIFLQIVVDRAGLIVERETGVFAFAHLTFQEYLAARAVADREDFVQFTADHLDDPWWREVVLLEVGYVSSPCTRRSRELTGKLVQAIFDSLNSPAKPQRSDRLLALRCLCDIDQLGVDETVRHKVVDDALAILRDPNQWPFWIELSDVLRYALLSPVGVPLKLKLLAMCHAPERTIRLRAAQTLRELGERDRADMLPN
ncbi:MAG: putative NTPase (NACHT family) [Limisphaerales bacterium]|nr:MAG: putative NTPase (NACHT family) [Limisphaerales bacterium]KAG0509503.1 MAG: putative NTPase (NACHT family) [Limisphaerales bacterium]TXT52339.1 MAG: putative NTPase (NACHT family) [Limisphaerales bacterium]